MPINPRFITMQHLLSIAGVVLVIAGVLGLVFAQRLASFNERMTAVTKSYRATVFTTVSLVLAVFLASAPFVSLRGLMRAQYNSPPLPKWLDVLLTPLSVVGFFGMPFVGIACLGMALVNAFRSSVPWWLKAAFWILTFTTFVGSYMELDFIGLHIGK